MKKSKGFIVIVVCLAVAILATSCTNQDSSVQGYDGETANVENGSSPDSFLGITLPKNKYGDFRLLNETSYATTADGLYEVKSIFPNSASIFYTDFATEQTIYLCNQPGCKHNTDACTSYIALKDNYPPTAVVTDDKLILIRAAATEASNPYIEIRNLDGSDNRKLCEFPANQRFDIYEVSDNNYLFTTMNEVDEKGNTRYYLVEINLSNGEVKHIVDTTTEFGFYQLVGAYENHLILQENNFDASTARQVLLNPENPSFDQEIGQYKLSGGYMFVMDNQLIAYDSETSEVISTNPKTEEEKTISLEKVKNQISGSIFPAFDGCIFYNQSIADAEGNPVTSRYLVNLTTGETHPLTLKTSTFKQYHWDVVAVYGDQLCVLYDYKEVPLVIENKEGDMETIESYSNLYGFISKVDYTANNPNVRPASSPI